MPQRILTILLSAAVTATCLGAQALSLSPRNTRNAGCHEHRSSPLPSPEPVSHKCCQIGHHTAILPQWVPLSYPWDCVALLADPKPQSKHDSFQSSLTTILHRGGPPGNAPLRV